MCVVHADCPEAAEELKKLVEENMPDKSVEVITAGIGPIIGATTGPGTLGVYCYGKKVTYSSAKG
ncbi:MAG: DegV family protein [Oscillospiraceae bacterium]